LRNSLIPPAYHWSKRRTTRTEGGFEVNHGFYYWLLIIVLPVILLTRKIKRHKDKASFLRGDLDNQTYKARKIESQLKTELEISKYKNNYLTALKTGNKLLKELAAEGEAMIKKKLLTGFKRK
jgi:hypothetical protein